jgi:hypothetical protein
LLAVLGVAGVSFALAFAPGCSDHPAPAGAGVGSGGSGNEAGAGNATASDASAADVGANGGGGGGAITEPPDALGLGGSAAGHADATAADGSRGDAPSASLDAGPKINVDASTGAFLHPGLLHSEEDLARMRAQVTANAQPWIGSWNRLVANAHSALTWRPNPAAAVYRGADGVHPENYAQLYNDAAAAYATALRWKISGDTAYADKSVEILNAWSSALTTIGGTSDKFLASGLYGYQMANAAEIMRTYAGWAAADFARFKSMMLGVFYPMNHDFLVRHNGACISHYWANWDLCNMDSMLAIGVLADDRAIYDEATNYFKNGAGTGSIGHVVVFLHPGNLGQWQESGRDQGHATLGVGLMGAFCEMAWKQGDDLYGYDDNRFLAGAEYVARYNLGSDVPYVTYSNCDPVTQTVVAPAGMGDIRPIWELVYNHYVNRRNLPAPNVTAYAAKVRPEGGGGDYGPNSGGYDQLGYGTLTATLDQP